LGQPIVNETILSVPGKDAEPIIENYARKNMQDHHSSLSLEMSASFSKVKCIVSGGQTGVDRTALDWAIQHDIPHGGWCPRGRKADEAFPIDTRYKLKETPSDDYAQRTAWNVRDADGTVIFSLSSQLTEGSTLTKYFTQHYCKPYIHIHRASPQPASQLLAFLSQHHIRVLNIAGPRASTEPEVGTFVSKVLDEAFLT
jgi:Circularly permutated YpsA SLOG family